MMIGPRVSSKRPKAWNFGFEFKLPKYMFISVHGKAFIFGFQGKNSYYKRMWREALRRIDELSGVQGENLMLKIHLKDAERSGKMLHAALMAYRQELRDSKNYATSDKLRDIIEKVGFKVEDTKG